MVFLRLARFNQAVQRALQAASASAPLRAARPADQDSDRAGRHRRLRGAEPGLIDAKRLARLIGAPSFPVTWFLPVARPARLPAAAGEVPAGTSAIRFASRAIRTTTTNHLPPRRAREGRDRAAAREGLAQREGWFR